MKKKGLGFNFGEENDSTNLTPQSASTSISFQVGEEK
jgi:hypothetical protein